MIPWPGGYGRRRAGTSTGRSWGVSLSLLLGLCPPALGQVVQVRLLDDSTGELVPGAIVQLRTSEDVVARALSDARGRVVLHVPTTDSFRIRVDRIGFLGVETATVALAVGDTLRRDIRLPSVRSDLPTIEVRERTGCETSPRGATRAAALWDDIRKALAANVLTQEQAAPLRIVYFERAVTGGHPGPERVVSQRTVRGPPFRSLEPAALASRGFLDRSEDTLAFAGPDAALLMSDEFVTTHCYRTVEGSDGLVGLAFEPVPGRALADIRGILWVHRATSELRFLEFEYTGMSGALQSARAGGRVEFRRRSSGAWIVDNWFIRTPSLEATLVRAPGGLTARGESIAGYSERGGRVEEVRTLAGEATERSAAVLRGTVYDSLAGAFLGGAVIRLAGAPDSAVTGANGAFRIAVSREGEQSVTVSHPRLGLVRDNSTRMVMLIAGREAVIDVAVPPISAFIRAFCGGEVRGAALLGLASGRSAGPEQGWTVQVSWAAGTQGAFTGVASAIVESGPQGVYAVCRLPPLEDLTIRLHDGVQVLLERSLRLRPGEFRWLDLRP